MPLAPLDEKARWQQAQAADVAMQRLIIEVCRDARALEAEWLAFQGRAAGTFFQTHQWCSTWLETTGAANGAKPLIIMGRPWAIFSLFSLSA